ncbi:phosphotransferase [Thiomicrospira cyclica]|uniref:Aminoglycoside phosphotransferase n=1 Tax=Thiomicrospira cyclica (strain DSM 14477 / JCM 11371 / ALM1) TaxID=717773 RepID=F6DCV1_THICA|nr:phosphotransferase [Thiomicrospira cyclica]AEG31687.1 aminoglycoside phosphotransferase [Thiomicrospira cyclica ALM1]
MNRRLALKTLTAHKKYFGAISTDHIDYFLKNNLPSHYAAKSDLVFGGGWSNLMRYSDVAKFYNDHIFYTMSVFSVCGLVSYPKYNYAEFIGKGAGKNTLNSYRKVTLENGEVKFEKVYKNNSDDLIKLKFFQEVAYNVISQDFKVPYADLVIGEVGTLAYFDWIDNVKPIDRRNILGFYSKFRSAAKHIAIPDHYSKNEVIYDFTREPMYQSGLKAAESWLIKHNFDSKDTLLLNHLSLYLKDTPSSERLFTHGDLAPVNLLQEDGVFDFDRCGYYPSSYELAFLCSKSLSFESLAQLDLELDMHIQDLSEINKIGFYFFAFIFYSRKIGIESSDAFLKELWVAVNRKAKGAGLEI